MPFYRLCGNFWGFSQTFLMSDHGPSPPVSMKICPISKTAFLQATEATMKVKAQATTRHAGRGFLAVMLHGIFFLFFLQLLTDFVAAVYAFGLLGTSIPPEIVSVLFLFSPIVLLGFRRGLSSKLMLGMGELFVLCRIVETQLDTRGRMLASGLGVALYLILLPSILWQESDRRGEPGWLHAGLGLVSAILVSFCLRAFHSGIDLSTDNPGISVGWLLGLTGGILWARDQLAYRQAVELPPVTTLSFGRLTVLCLGLMGTLVLLYFGFSTPNVLARWLGLSYTGVLAILCAAYSAIGLILTFRPGWIIRLNTGFWVTLNLTFTLALVGSILSAQVVMPNDPAAYPFYAVPMPVLGLILFWIALILSPVIFINFARYWMEIVSGQHSLGALAGGFTIASLFLLIMIFTHIFTTVYDYFPVIGPFFRDKFWLVYLLACAGMFLPGLLAGRTTSSQKQQAPTDYPYLGKYALVVIFLGAAAVIGSILDRPRPSAVGEPTDLKVLTYNVQQGYSETGQKNFDGQLAVIRSLNPDVVGLQETDTNRIAGGNADLVRYLADSLNYYSYYGPSTIAGTFGIALLSRYPILEPGTFYMYSGGEQTATIKAQILVGDQLYHLFITHLGNGGPIVQQRAILQEVGNLQDVVLMGDFNFRPDTQAYELTTQWLIDSWLATWPNGIDGSGIYPNQRIDHIFVSSGLNIQESHFLRDPASDHPALITTLGN
jgi:endonuclease/exonuclease/phosphatase family metal-dependent hydrolase